MIRIVLVLFCLMTTIARADAVECATRPSAGTYSQYRLIDGRKCWYPGRHTRQKSELQWTAKAIAPVVVDAPMRAQAPVMDFTARWVDPPETSILPQQAYDRLDDDISAGRTFFVPVRAAGFDAAMLYTEPPRSPATVVAVSSMSTAGSSLITLGWLFLVSSILAAVASLRTLGGKR